jgi:LmbE family N-acetylglucosaminyl deacetylase
MLHPSQMMADLSPLLGRTLVLVAHPDDEAVGCGALMQRMHEPVVVFATDGAPRDDYFWKTYGSRLRYSRVRQVRWRFAAQFSFSSSAHSFRAA